jgi:hypothetical protein
MYYTYHPKLLLIWTHLTTDKEENQSGHPLVGKGSKAHHCLASRSAYQTMTDKYRNK